LLLALINATAILVIVAAIFALVVIARINGFAENVVATMTEAVLSKVDLPQKDVLANIRNLTAEVRTLGNTLRDVKTGEHPAVCTENLNPKDGRDEP
jgi:flagellar motor component MotA